MNDSTRPTRSTRSQRRLRAAVATGAVLAATVSTVLAGAGSASAAIHQCYISGDRTNCAYVTGINAGSYLAIRTAPSYGAAKLPGQQWHNGEELGVSCWTTGDPDADGHGYRYWMEVDTGVVTGYVNDWYLDTGGPSTWKQQLSHC
ncbi:hypothetical protein [Streptomyces sp. 3214.6]|uniref:hypothetical protein n=1 Tax=Streptomyces sp. 3214.6 TaxID=1882757 RepID=UPI0009097AB2|nr:hypothetical protein [Streptomyces sp. 3214.6]SHI22569.1 hypothetical protein SAMN05444521_5693 [Streptomyces sp. 3214.6]